MIEKIFIISMWVFAIWYTMQPGEIFEKLADWLAKVLPPKLHSPIFDCPVCMVPWHGSLWYWLLFMPMRIDPGFIVVVAFRDIVDWITVAIAAMGLNAVITKLWPKEQIRIKEKIKTNTNDE